MQIYANSSKILKTRGFVFCKYLTAFIYSVVFLMKVPNKMKVHVAKLPSIVNNKSLLSIVTLNLTFHFFQKHAPRDSCAAFRSVSKTDRLTTLQLMSLSYNGRLWTTWVFQVRPLSLMHFANVSSFLMWNELIKLTVHWELLIWADLDH